MRKFITLILTFILVLSLAACGQSSENTKVEEPKNETTTNEQPTAKEPKRIPVIGLDEESKEVETYIAKDPQRIAVLDIASLDILKSLGLADRVVGVTTTQIPYLQDVVTKEGVKNIGTLKSPDLEAIMELEPDLILMGGRAGEFYKQLYQIAPTLRLSTYKDKGVVESTKINSQKIASIFGLEEKVDELFQGFDTRIQALKEKAKGKTAIVGIVTNGGFNVAGNDGRLSLVGREIGFENIGVESDTQTVAHGNEASFEFIVQKNPDYIFVLDRDAAIATEGAQLAKDIMENELVKSTDAYKDGNLVIVENSAVWYTAEGGISALDIMLKDLESTVK